MYILSVAHVALDLVHLAKDVGNARALQGLALICVAAIENGAPATLCDSSFDLTPYVQSSGHALQLIALTIVNVSIAWSVPSR